MHYRLVRYLFIILPILFFSSCRTPEPIKIGFIAALSGRNSELGVSSREALILQTDKWNKNGGINGHRIELIFADDKSDPETGINEMKRLAEENVSAIIGPFTSNMLPAIKAEEAKDILIISPTISTSVLSGLNDNFIRLIPAASEQGKFLSALMINDNITWAAVIWDTSNPQYTEDVKTVFENSFTIAGGKITLRYPFNSADAPDFKDLPIELEKSCAQAVLVITSGMDAAAIAQQIKKRGSDVMLYGSRWTKTYDLIEAGGKAVEGMKIVSSVLDCDNIENKNFTREFSERTGREPIFAAIYTYETAGILFDALYLTKEHTLNNLKEQIIGKKYAGFCEDIEVDEFGDTTREQVFSVIENGRFLSGE